MTAAPVFDPVLELRDCHKRFRGRGRPALDGVSFCAARGRVTALVGPNGAGKSTALRAACGLVHLTAGTIHVLGAQVPRELWTVASRIGIVPDNPSWFPRFDVTTTVELAGRLRGVPAGRVPAVLDLVGLRASASTAVGALSFGMRRRLALAIALLHDPELLLLDEPANGLDPQGHAQLRRFVQDFANDGGSVVLSSHLLGDVEKIAHDVVVIAEGRTVRSGPLGSFLAASPGVRVRADGREGQALVVLHAAGLSCRLTDPPGPCEVLVSGDVEPEHIALTLARAGIGVSFLAPAEVAFETSYLGLIDRVEASPWGR